MNILAIDTSGPVAGVAILSNGVVTYEAAAVNRFTHSVNLMPMVEESLQHTELDIAAIDLFAAVTGPGSFTGVRIGVSAIKGMAHGASKPCIGINALEALAAGFWFTDALLCPIQDARANQVYGAAFRAGMPPERILYDTALKLDAFIELALRAAQIGQKLCFIGDGVKPYRAAIEERLGDCAVFPPAHLSYLRPSSVAILAQAKAEDAVDYLTLQPVYLRAPQAERARAARLEQQL